MALDWNDKAVLAKMEHMKTKVVKDAARKGVRAGSKIRLAKAKMNASNLETSGNVFSTSQGMKMSEIIAASLKIRRTPRKTLHAKDGVADEVFFNTSKYPMLIYHSKKMRSFIPFAIEYGHVAPNKGKKNRRYKGLNVRNIRGKVAKPKPFMIPAHETTKHESLSKTKAVMGKEIDRAWSK